MNCGKGLPNDAQFCRYCGASQEVSEIKNQRVSSPIPQETDSWSKAAGCATIGSLLLSIPGISSIVALVLFMLFVAPLFRPGPAASESDPFGKASTRQVINTFHVEDGLGTKQLADFQELYYQDPDRLISTLDRVNPEPLRQAIYGWNLNLLKSCVQNRFSFRDCLEKKFKIIIPKDKLDGIRTDPLPN